MADVELVIKMPETLKRIADEEDYKAFSHPVWLAILMESIRSGVPLPKGHGDLIDRGELKTHFIGTEQGTDLEVYLEPTIINATPIIEADKTESE